MRKIISLLLIVVLSLSFVTKIETETVYAKENPVITAGVETEVSINADNILTLFLKKADGICTIQSEIIL